MAKKNTNAELFSALLYILIGLLLVIFRSQTLGWAMTIAGAIFVICGVLELVKKNWTGGAVSMIIGIAILVLGWVVKDIVIPILGILIALRGVLSLIDSLRAFKKNCLEIIFALLTVAVGLLLAFGNLLDLIIVISGVSLMFNGVVGLLASLTGKR